jgi:hypothetical protein
MAGFIPAINYEVIEMVEFEEQQRVLHAPFDVETHKKTFINYLEVIIHSDGTIEYAVPSHMIKLQHIYGKSMDEIFEEYQHQYEAVLDPVEWLCKKTGCISVWECGYMGMINDAQRKSLQLLHDNDLYHGRI